MPDGRRNLIIALIPEARIITGWLVLLSTGINVGGTDVDALEEGYASVVPIKFDLTDEGLRERLERDWSDIIA